MRPSVNFTVNVIPFWVVFFVTFFFLVMRNWLVELYSTLLGSYIYQMAYLLLSIALQPTTIENASSDV